MGTAAAPWKQRLVQAMESNSRLRHSSYFQLVRSSFFFLYLFPSFISFLFVVDIVLVWVSGNDWIKWETFESHRRFQVFSQLNQIRLKQKWN